MLKGRSRLLADMGDRDTAFATMAGALPVESGGQPLRGPARTQLALLSAGVVADKSSSLYKRARGGTLILCRVRTVEWSSS